MTFETKRIISDSYRFSKREFASKYSENILGYVWIVLNPVFMMLLYVAVFGYIFQGSFNEDGNHLEYGVGIFIGLTLYGFIGEALALGPNLVLSKSNIVQKVHFPLEIIPITALFNIIYKCAITILISILAVIIYRQEFTYYIFLLPIFLAPIIFFALGILALLSSIGVYFRDIENIIALLNRGLFFGSAIFYPLDHLPEEFRKYIYLNPIAVIIDLTRNLVLWDILPDFSTISVLYLSSVASCILSLIVFKSVKSGFTDVL